MTLGVGYSHTGCLGSIALGSFPVIWSNAGSALFVAVLSVLTGRRAQ